MPALRRDLALARNCLGALFYEMGNREEAIEQFLASVETYDVLRQLSPETPGSEAELAASQAYLALTQTPDSEFQKAKELLELVTDRLRESAARDKSDLAVRRFLMTAVAGQSRLHNARARL